MADNDNGSKQSKALVILLIIAGGVVLWLYNRELFVIVATYSTLVIIGLALFVLLPFILFVLLPYFSRLYHYFQRFRTVETVKVIFSRRDESQGDNLTNFFDFLNGTLLPEFSVHYMYRGANTFSWEFRAEKENAKNLYLSATSGLLKTITKNIQAIYPNVRFEAVDEQPSRAVPNRFMQMRLEGPWYQSIETSAAEGGGGKPLIDSLISTMDGIEGEAGVQFVITPLSPRKQRKKRFKHTLNKVGGALFECEIRVYASDSQVLKGIVGTIGEINAHNNIIAEQMATYYIRQLLRNFWWKHFVEKSMPTRFLGPTMWFKSYHLAAFFQFPSEDLRVGGLERHIHRRLPVPQGIPTEVDIPLVETDDGQQIGLTEEMRGRNLMVIGTGGTGKSSTMAQYGIPIFADPNQASVIVTSAPHEAQIYLQFVPPHKKVYIIDVDQPGEYGLNFLSLDYPADILSEFLISTLETFYGDKMKEGDMELVKQAYTSLRKAQEVSPAWKKVMPTIDLRHVREVLANEKYRLRLIQALPKESDLRNYWINRTQLMRNPRFYVRFVQPILNALSRVLANDRIAKTYCHPTTFDMRKALLEEKAVVVLHGGKWDFGFDIHVFSANMFLSLAYLSIMEQFKLPPEETQKVNFFLDDFGAYTGRAIMMLCVRGGRLGVRLAGTSGTFFDVPENMRIIMNIAFANKIIFRTHKLEEAKHWSEQVEQLTDEDFFHFKPFNAAVWLMVGSERKDVFVANTIFSTEYAKWKNYHPWPDENKELQLNRLALPSMEADDVIGGDFDVSFKNKKQNDETG